MHRIVLILCVSLLLAACSSRVIYDTASAPSISADAININTASADELDRLPHIGRKTAETIVQFREKNGPFRRPEYLLQIRGISEARFAEIKPYLKTE